MPQSADAQAPAIPSSPAAPPPAPPPIRSNAVLDALLEISNYVGSVMILDEILERILEITARVMDGQSCSIYLWNEDRSRLVMRCNLGLEPELIGSASFEPGRGIPGWVALHGEVAAIEEASRDPRHNPLSSTRDRNFKAYLCAPLRIQHDVIGVMVLRKKQAHRFSPDEITTYETICKQVAIVVEKSRLYEARIEAEKLAAVAVSISGVAHFIKNLLLSMKGGEYLIETGLKRGDLHQATQGWGVLKRSTAKIRDMVENMLNYYRDSDLHPRPVELNTLLLEILQSLEDRAMEKHAVLTPDLDLRIEKVEIDPDAFQDVVINMVTNAIDALPPDRKGWVQIQTRLDENQRSIRIAFKDNGTGIKAEDQDKIFQLFFSTKGKRGTGIGLAASRKIVLDHHGTIEAHSEPGVGTEFVITLPLQQPRG